jgi:pSer/pThr/pTyr-binding forkhead associated (FHA) protein
LIVKIGILALLWGFVLVAIAAVRTDMFGPSRRQQRRGASPSRSSVAAPPRPAQPRPAAARPQRRNPTPSKLIVTKGALTGTEIPLGPAPITIGRAPDSTLVLDDDFASARHARLVPHDGQWMIEDLGSTNGTYLDRTKVTTPMPVSIGAPVRIGKTVLELHR